MIVLDTNVVSELLRPVPERTVASWFRAQTAADIFVSAVTEAELRFGAAIMSLGRRREAKAAAIEAILAREFAGQILPFDSNAAAAYASIAAARRLAGRPISQLDCQIAAIARSRGAAVATRNTADFEHTGVKLIDPWHH